MNAVSWVRRWWAHKQHSIRNPKRRQSWHCELDVLEDRTVPSSAAYIGNVPYATIQDAVTAATAGETILIEPGTYTEQVVINQNLTLEGSGQGSTTIQPPATLAKQFTTSKDNYPIITVTNSATVTIEDLTVNGTNSGNSYGDGFEGIAFYNAGGTVNDVTITNVANTPFNGDQNGVALYADNADSAARTLTVTNDSISGYQKNGMALSGTGLTVDVENNTVTGAGPTALIAQNGIQVGFGAGGTINNNSVSGDSFDAPENNPATASGILLYDSAAINITNNTIGNSDEGIAIVDTTGSNAAITGNSISASYAAGIYLWQDSASPAAFNISGNTIENGVGNGFYGENTGGLVNTGDGIDVFGNISGTTITNNAITNNTGTAIYLGGSPADVAAGDIPATDSGSLAISDNIIVGGRRKTTYSGVDNESSITVNASGNWWGTTSPSTIDGLNHDVHIGSYLGDGNTTATVGLTPEASTTMFVPKTAATSGLTNVDGNIQDGINTAVAGMTVQVAADSYTENLVVNKPLTLTGAGQASTFVYPAVSDPGDSSNVGSQISASDIVLVQASNVTIDGFTFDGSQPKSTSSTVVNGVPIDARNGIITDFNSGTYLNLTVYNNTVENVYERGIYSTGLTYGNTFDIYDNSVSNVDGNSGSIAIFNFGGSGVFESNHVSLANDAISANWSQGTQFLNNVITNSGSGIHTDNNGGAGGVADLIQGNTVSSGSSSGSYGIYVFVPYVAVTVEDNNVSGVDVGLAAYGGAGGSATFTDNTVSTNASDGMGALVTTDQLGYDTGSVSATFSGNSLTGGQIGLYVEQPLDNSTPSSVAQVSATDNTITGNSVVGVQIYGGTVSLTQNTIENNGIGVQVDGGTLTSASQNFISNNTGDGIQVGAQQNFAGIFGAYYSYDVPQNTTGAVSAAFDNDLASNTGLAVDNTTANPVNASGNWWGTASPSAIDAMNHDVHIGSYLGDGNTTATVGFTPEASTTMFVPETAATSHLTNVNGNIQDGINTAVSGMTVDVAADTYAGSVTIDKPLTLNGAQAGADANARFAAFTAGKANPSVESIITAGTADPTTVGNALLHIESSDVTVNGFVLDGNNPSLPTGSAVQINGTGPYVDARNGIDTTDTSNNGQAVNNLLIENNIVQNVNHDGIALIGPSDGSAVTSGSVITGNVISNFTDYGVLLAYNAYADITANTITMPNNAEAGVWVYDFTANGATAASQTVNIAQNNITAGQDDFGGIWANLDYAPSATLNITDNTVNAGAGVNGADGYTNGIYLSTLQDGFSADLSGNIVGSSGGQFATGISLWNLPTTVPVSVSGGSVGDSMVGIEVDSNDINFGPAAANSVVNVSNITVSGATTGLFVEGFSPTITASASLLNSTLTGNSGTSGGGIYAGNDSSVTVTNSTLSGNSAANDGGGIYAADGSTVTVTNTTLAGNSAGAGGGIYAAVGSDVTLTNTLVARNTLLDNITPSDIDGSIEPSSSYNLIGTGGAGGLSDTNGNQVSVSNPGLAPLNNYGGPTQTMALYGWSPAVNAGSLLYSPPTDQRGFLRDAYPDIGAYEFEGATGVTSSTPNGAYTVGALIHIQVDFSQPVFVTGTPELTLSNGAIVDCTTGTGTTTLTFDYTVAVGQDVNELDYASASALVLNSAAIKDVNGNDVALTLPDPGTFGSLGVNKTIKIDTTAPTAGTVYDGTTTGTETSFQASATTISANWTDFSDSGSGVASYEWAIGTTAGGANIQAYTSVGTATSATNSSLKLSNGTKYYVSVEAVDNAGNVSEPASSNGVTVDDIAPTTGTVYDGTTTGTETTFQASTTTISANWSGFNASSGIASYQWAIGTTLGGQQILSYTSAGISGTTASKSGLSLSNGTTYYVSVKATDNVGNVSNAATSSGVTVVNDNFNSPNSLSGWNANVGTTPIVNGRIASTNTATANVAILNGLAQNVALQADIVVGSANGQYAGLVARYSGGGDTNMYWGAIVRNGPGFIAVIDKNVGGHWSTLSSAAVPAPLTGTGTLFFDVTGSSLKLYYGPTGTTTPTLLTYAFDSSLTNGRAGFRISGSATDATTLDNFAGASIPAPATQTLPFIDNLTTPGALYTIPTSSNQLDANWVESMGNFKDTGTGAVGQVVNGNSVATVSGVNAADVSVQAKVTLSAVGQYAGLVARYTAAGSFYAARIQQINSTQVRASIMKYVNGAWTTIPGASGLTIAASVNNTSGDALTFQAEGPSLKLFLGTTLIAYAQDFSFATGSVGIYAYGDASLANFNATAVASATSLTFADTFAPGTTDQLANANWVELAGNFNTSTGKGVGEAAGLNAALVRLTTPATDVSAQANVTLSTVGQIAGLIARASASNNSYYVGRIQQVSATQVQATIWKYTNGNGVQLGAPQTISGVKINASDALVFQAEGSSLKLFVNGKLATYAQDTSLTSGSVGIYTYGAAGGATIQSGFSASAITSGVTLPYPDSLKSSPFASQLNNADWIERAGNFNVTGAGAVGQAGTNLATLIGPNQASANLALNIAFTGAGQQAGLVARYSGPGDDNYYYASVTSMNASGTTVNVELWKNVNGTLIKLTNPQLVTGFHGGLDFTVSDNTLTLTTDGVHEQLQITDASITGTGFVGIRTTPSVTLSNFSAS